MQKNNPTISAMPHETMSIAVLLAFVGGFLDAYTYILRGGVFANAQTGNIVLMGISVAKGSWQQVLYHAVPIIAFFVGILLTLYIKSKCDNTKMLHWEHMVFPIEMAILFIVGFIPSGFHNGIVNVTVSFVCSIQVQSFRVVHNTPYASTMCTGNLRSAAECLFKFCTNKQKENLYKFLRYIYIISSFILGACIGSYLSGILNVKAVWICCVVFAFAFLFVVIRNKNAKNQEDII